ncbi:MAG: carbon monoxide dehydrogenase subunit G [Thermomicrobiaceae bacterium]
MKISGSYTVNAERQDVWNRLLDPDSLSNCLPGVERLDKTAENEYDMAMNVGVGMIRGTYEGKVRITEINEPTDYKMYVEGSGRPGFVKGTGKIDLAESVDGKTEITYEGDVEVGGPVGSVAQRMMGSVSKRMIDQFFSCVEEQIKQGS